MEVSSFYCVTEKSDLQQRTYRHRLRHHHLPCRAVQFRMCRFRTARVRTTYACATRDTDNPRKRKAFDSAFWNGGWKSLTPQIHNLFSISVRMPWQSVDCRLYSVHSHRGLWGMTYVISNQIRNKLAQIASSHYMFHGNLFRCVNEFKIMAVLIIQIYGLNPTAINMQILSERILPRNVCARSQPYLQNLLHILGKGGGGRGRFASDMCTTSMRQNIWRHFRASVASYHFHFIIRRRAVWFTATHSHNKCILILSQN